MQKKIIIFSIALVIFVGMLVIFFVFIANQNATERSIKKILYTTEDATSQNNIKEKPVSELTSAVDHVYQVPGADVPGWLEGQSLGIAVDAGPVSRFYPFQVLREHEIVNDVLGGQPILIAHCTVCMTAVAYNPVVNGAHLLFDTTSYLWDGSLVISDRSEEMSLWSQAEGRVIAGNLNKQQMDILPFDIMTVTEYIRTYPQGNVMIGDATAVRTYAKLSETL